MTDVARKIYEEALSLTDDERLTLAEALFDSLTARAQALIDEAWREEILRRMEETRKGEVELESWDEVRSAGRAALGR